MDLKEAFDIIDATLGMFKSFECEIENGVLKEDFLLTRVKKCNESVIDEKLNYEILSREFYTYVDCDTEYKMYIVDIRPVCTYLVNEWPSYSARRVRKVLNEVFRECLEICEVHLKGIVDITIDEGYNFYRMYNTGSQDTRNIEHVMLDTIHEMYYALKLTEEVKSEEQDQIKINGVITEDLANSIDWNKLTKGFDLERIKDIVNTIGKTKRDKKIIVKALYDAETASEFFSKIPYSVDKLLNNLYKEYDENHRGLLEVSTETLNLDKLLKQAIDEYMEKHVATDKDIDDYNNYINVDGISKSDKIGNFTKRTLPIEFRDPKAEQFMQKLYKAGLIDSNWQPAKLSISERGYLAEFISNHLHIKSKWKVLGALWKNNPETLRQGKNKALEQVKTRAFIEKINKITN